MPSIQNALGQLFDSLERLESSAGKQEQKAARRGRGQMQPDLFSGVTSAFVVDPSIVANKIDGAIEKIEKLLREG